MKMDTGILIVGIGSPHGDDQAGWLVVEGLSVLTKRANVELQFAKTPTDLLDWLDGNDHPVKRLLICDASHGAGKVGEIRNWNWPSPEFSEVTMSGTHNLSLPTVLALAEQLGRLPAEISIWTIEGATNKSSSSLSPRVSQAVPELVKRIFRETIQFQPGQELPCTNNP